MLNKLNVKFSLLFLVLPTGLLVAQNCNDKVEIIFDNLVESIGNYSMEKDALPKRGVEKAKYILVRIEL